LRPHTMEAGQWILENLPEKRMEWSLGVVIEHRMLGDVIEGILLGELSIAQTGERVSHPFRGQKSLARGNERWKAPVTAADARLHGPRALSMGLATTPGPH
jgi:hypothetical protein